MIRHFDSLMLRTLLGPLVAALQLFALYVLLHGHYSPGGGFQAGILLAASLILPLLTKGEGGQLTLSTRGAVTLTAVGVLIFALIGVLPLLWGMPMLDYGALPLSADPAERRSLGILLVEVGVTLAVAGAMVAIFYGLAGEIGEEAS